MDSSEVRSSDEAELDQNGVLLYALEQYVRWTGDVSMMAEHWARISAVAEYPLRPEFAHPECGLLVNSREFWERHRIHGITPGMELAHQVFVPIGLRAAARLAVALRQPEQAARWASHAERLRAATLSHPRYGFVRDGALVKRLNLDGTVQDRIEPASGSTIPPGAPLQRPGAHWLNPDTCVTLPVAFGFIAPDSELARRTLDSVEPLWNQDWQTGGYGRTMSPRSRIRPEAGRSRRSSSRGRPSRRGCPSARGGCSGGWIPPRAPRRVRGSSSTDRARRRRVRRWGSSRGPGRRCSRSWSSTCSACDRGQTACTSLPGCCRGSTMRPPVCGSERARSRCRCAARLRGAVRQSPHRREARGGARRRRDRSHRHRAPRRRHRRRHRPSARMTLHG